MPDDTPSTVEERPDDADPGAQADDDTSGLSPAEYVEPLPEHKADLVALAIDRKIPSYTAWDMTVDELKEALRG